MIELMVAIGVIGMLAAILLPAIQASREASRRINCSSHLHQLAIASQNHVATHGHYPGRVEVKHMGVFNTFYALLPFVEAKVPLGRQAVRVEVYQCPSEPHEDRGSAWDTNYLVNNGSHIYLLRHGTEAAEGLLVWDEILTPRDVSDGESHTAIFSERMYLPSYDRDMSPADTANVYRQNPRVLTWGLGRSFFHGQEDEFHMACGDTAQRHSFTITRPLTNPDIFGRAWYDHVLPPNAAGCMYIAPPRPFGGWNQPEYAFPANSAHPGGVMVALCDGATRFVSEGIDVHVWRAVGTRNGNDPVGAF